MSRVYTANSESNFLYFNSSAFCLNEHGLTALSVYPCSLTPSPSHALMHTPQVHTLTRYNHTHAYYPLAQLHARRHTTHPLPDHLGGRGGGG